MAERPEERPEGRPAERLAGRPEPLRLFGSRSDAAVLDWDWVEQQLVAAGTYWVIACGPGHPHPRPVWGVWTPDQQLWLSIGSPGLRRELDGDPRVTVHLDSGTDVVVVEGLVTPAVSDAASTSGSGPVPASESDPAQGSTQGSVQGSTQGSVQSSAPGSDPVQAYNAKYDWDYRVEEYGELVAVHPVKVLAWRCAGWAGRDGFQTTGSWVFDPHR